MCLWTRLLTVKQFQGLVYGCCKENHRDKERGGLKCHPPLLKSIVRSWQSDDTAYQLASPPFTMQQGAAKKVKSLKGEFLCVSFLFSVVSSLSAPSVASHSSFIGSLLFVFQTSPSDQRKEQYKKKKNKAEPNDVLLHVFDECITLGEYLCKYIKGMDALHLQREDDSLKYREILSHILVCTQTDGPVPPIMQPKCFEV